MLKRVTDLVVGKFDHFQQSLAHRFHLSASLQERQLLLSGQIAAQQVRRLERIDSLADVEFRVTSQWGEDGIIEWLCHKLPMIERSFVEFGVENYGEANTRFLLRHRGWRGLILDGNPDYMAQVRGETLHWMHDLVAHSAFVTAENIDGLIEQAGFAGELGILSVDIDGNDYWVLKAIRSVRPALIIAEFNGVLGDRHAITVPYDPTFERLKAHHSGQYFGASLPALTRLAEAKGYRFLGTNSNGVNAFFLRDDLAGPVLGAIARVVAWPPRHRDSRGPDGALTYVRGTAKAELIKALPVQEVTTGETMPLGELFPLYSDAWQREI